MPRYALLDGDLIAYRAAAASQRDLDWDDGDGATTTVSPDAAGETAVSIVHAWTALANCREPIVCLSSPVNFRRTVWPSYKGNRAKVARPIALPHVQSYLRERFQTFTLHGLEADDVMGILATSDRYADSVIVSLDKDMLTIPATVFSPTKDMRPQRIRPLAADLWWMTQTLMGDSTDGYPGCPKIGPKKAEAILAEAGPTLPAMWAAVVAAYEAKDQTEDDALTMARLARILRRTDYNRKTEEIFLWHPTTPVSLSLRSCGTGLSPA